MHENERVTRFLETFSDRCPVYFPEIQRNYNANTEQFSTIASPLLEWAERVIGPRWDQTVADGYNFLLAELNRAQVEYERNGKYSNLSFQDVLDTIYTNDEYMEKYHWGLYVAAFAWEHHLKLTGFFKDYFLSTLQPKSGKMLDLGSGSGLWSFLAALQLENWSFEGIDLSPGSVNHAKSLADASGLSERVSFNIANALDHHRPGYDAVMSGLLLEHLEQPALLLENMARNLNPHGMAFLIGALTAAQPDHIFEIRHESEIVDMCEKAGFRVIAMFSSAPVNHPDKFNFIPRSAGLVLQKRKGEIW